MDGSKIKPVDVITFGSPCQDMSIAGKREGLKHSDQGDDETTRSGLFFEAIRIIKEMRKVTNGEYPKYAVWENVPGAFSSNKGWDFLAVLEAICSVCDSAVSIPKPYDTKKPDKLKWNGAGEIVGDSYSVCWRTLDAQYWGVPQRRKRIYLVADFNTQCAREISFKPDSLRRDLPKSNEQGEKATSNAMGCLNGRDRILKIAYGADCRNGALNEDITPTLQAKPNGGFSYNCISPVVYSFDSLASNSMKSHNPNSGYREVDISKCIDTTFPDPSKNQGGIAIVQELFEPKSMLEENWEQANTKNSLRANSSKSSHCVVAFAQNQRNEVRDLNGKAGALAAEAGVHQQTYVCESSVYDMTHACDVIRDCGDVAPTIQNRMGTGGNQVPLTIENAKPPRKYIIRRLIPTECARLQGFPDDWGDLKAFNPEDAKFWESVRKIHAEINGKKYKPCKDIKALQKWYEKLHNDGAEYKMWGNGIALPCAEYVLHNLAEHNVKTLGSLFDGSGGFPLAGLMNGIAPLWTSEIEPYPVAVTKSRFE